MFDESPILDVACGTGNYSVALSKLGLNVTGVDISAEMVRQAKQKSLEIQWDISDVNNLPYDNRTFNGATCILAIHHFNDLIMPFQEIHRVMNSGRFVIFTSSPEQMESYWLTEYFPKAIELSCSR